MTQEEKELLLVDLCSRLPYGVKVLVPSWDEIKMEYIDRVDKLYSINMDDRIQTGGQDYDDYDFNINEVKPYLFPMSSMTEEQKVDMIKSSCGIGSDKNVFDWYNKNHFDYRGLIPLDLAIDATGLNIY